MIKRRTVLVVGAGASCHYGFPSAAELYDRLTFRSNVHVRSEGQLSYSRYLEPLLAYCGHSVEELHAFTDALQYSGTRSIDHFLEHRPDLAPLGKRAIAATLIPNESPHALFGSAYVARSWYHYLFTQLVTRPGVLPIGNLSIVTFNYDRSLEAFIWHSLVNQFSYSAERAEELAASFQIIHVHGLLGEFTAGGRPGRRYSTDVTAEAISTAASAIRVVSEADGESAQYAAAREALRKAQRVYFLGFGYNRVCLERLRVQEVPRDAEIWGTTFGMTRKEIEAVCDMLGRALRMTSDSHDVHEFLRHAPDLTV